ncbi:MAG: prolyl-tRNA synthetase associated domain-containing protein [Oscillospiraceae bacterium]|nr:prolyl-tRNA synthetase associated domain-containing protein [Oscillospiraceae bacterium]
MEPFYVDPVLHTGRPTEKRSEVEDTCYDLLDGLGVGYDRADHDAAGTIEACAAVEAVIGVHICKNLFLCNRQQTEYYLLMMPGDKPFKTKDFSRQLGIARVSFGTPEAMEAMLRLTPGSVSILGLQFDPENRVRLCIDGDVARAPFMRCHPNKNTSTLRLRTQDVLSVLLPYMHHKPTFVELPWPEQNEPGQTE